MGYHATLFDAQNRMGGLLANGFPSYRLPKHVVEKDLAIIEKMGIEIQLGKRIGRDVTSDDLRKSFDAIFVATGVSGTDFMMQAFKGLKKTRWGTIQVHPISLETNLHGVFAAATWRQVLKRSSIHGREERPPSQSIGLFERRPTPGSSRPRNTSWEPTFLCSP
jgi:NADPH-dependent glutamate synthase beta subunit-like oxidoreductase